MENESIIWVQNLDREPFYAKYLERPALITNMAVNCIAFKKWNFDYLDQQLGEVEINVSKQDMLKTTYFRTKIHSFIKYLKSFDGSIGYYSNFSSHIGTNLEHDYNAPACFECWYRSLPKEQQSLVLSWIYLGSANSFSLLHIDVYSTSAWNALFVGKKLWVFFPPDQADLLYNGDVNPFNPDLNKYPLYKKAKPLVCIQEPGDVVYTASGWWHAVFNLEMGFALTENFINESNFENVRNDLLLQNAHNAVTKLDSLRQ